MPVSVPLADWRSRPVLPPEATARLDAAAMAAGISGPELMEAAGRAVTRIIGERFAPQPVLVLCGPGNNGGDGYVIARRLHAAGWPVRVLAMGEPARLPPDARAARERLPLAAAPLAAAALGDERLVVDALFGVGLARPIAGAAGEAIQALAAGDRQVVAVDIPSGVLGGTGAAPGPAIRATLTVTFVTAKPGHLLLPGRLHTGELLAVDIGIGQGLVEAEAGATPLRVNDPALWQALLPRRTPETHKYSFGHALVLGGPGQSSGAARLAAGAALRVGAGLVTIGVAPAALPAYAAHLTAIMLRPVGSPRELARLLDDRRLAAFLIGPAAGTGMTTRHAVEALIADGRPVVLDADALTVCGPPFRAGELAFHGRCVLTPHDGEFARLFDHAGDRLARARAAAAEANAVILLKGGDTVVAAPDGRSAILIDAPPTLATAGTGDVLAGLITGLLAQGMAPFEAAAAGAWLHGAAARQVGPGLTAEDLAPALPALLRTLN